MRLILLFLLYPISSTIVAQKTINALRISETITIDGLSNESVWENAETGGDFINISPNPGVPSEEKTTVKILYDDEAMYIYVDMEEVSRDSIMMELSQRDNLGNTDAIGLLLDTYNNGTDGIILVVGATGVQYDARKENTGREDGDWDAVWFSDVNIRDDGWSCEMMIPYAAIRFPKKDEQSWRINFLRGQRKNNTFSMWNFVDPNINGVFNQSGTVTNINNIKPPVRISLTPYLSTYSLFYKDVNADPIKSSGYSYNAGMDIKYGITDAFTLDMTLIPDFGQVESDDLVVNLSPFEVQLSEKRPFFTEGIELFSKGDLFYSRRIGGTALNRNSVGDDISENESIESNPQIPQLYNASKISGRNSKGLGLGILNAIEARTEATIINGETGEKRKIVTSPLTNYSMVVIDQNLPNNSYVSIINSNVYRRGSEFYDANVIATDFDLKDKKQNYRLTGVMAYSVQDYSDRDDNNGHRMEIEASKISGRWGAELGYEELSVNYNHNDLGFLRNANERNAYLGIYHRVLQPVGKINRGNFWLNVDYSRLYEPNVYTNTHYNWGFWVETKKFWNFNMWFNYGTDKKDYFEPRTNDFSRYVIRPSFKSAGTWVGTDNRKKFFTEAMINVYSLDEEGRWGYFYRIAPRFRFSNKLSMTWNWRYNIQYDDTGWVADGDSGEIYLGQRDQRDIENIITLNYNFTENIGFNLRTRHNWNTAVYRSFHELAQDGSIPLSTYSDDIDYSESHFSVDMGFNWRFAPGSDMFLVWKNNIDGGFTGGDLSYGERTYIDGLGALNEFPQQNSISLRITYYLDQTNFKKWLAKA